MVFKICDFFGSAGRNAPFRGGLQLYKDRGSDGLVVAVPPEILGIIRLIPVLLILLVIWGVAVFGLIAVLRKVGVPSKVMILTGFLIFGGVIGAWSFQEGKKDIVAALNLPGSTVSEIVYNDYLLPYWKSTLEPVGYEHIPIRDLKTGEVIGVEDVPQYDFPLKKVSDLYMPVSIVSWGLLGLLLQLVYNRRMKTRANFS